MNTTIETTDSIELAMKVERRRLRRERLDRDFGPNAGDMPLDPLACSVCGFRGGHDARCKNLRTTVTFVSK